MDNVLAVVALAALGSVSGVPGHDASIEVFKGIPFAAPPVGALRWRAPQPAVGWSGVRKADRFGNSCIQREVMESKPWTYEFMNHAPISEDCLYLNVWTAAKRADAKLPVFVYIYGGGFNEGSGAVPAYDGEGLARKGLVVVTFNYRVGTLGFLAHPELTAESSHHSSGNYGLLDQIAALEWVKANIGRFGGDAARVTIAGQSAGGSSVHALMASPLAKGLFARAIVESGSVPSAASSPGLKRAEEIGVEFAKSKGAGSVAELRALSPDKLTGRGVRLILDGWVLPEALTVQNDVPLLSGSNMHEGEATPQQVVTAEAYRASATQRFGDGASEFLKLYPTEASQNEASWDQARASMYGWARERAAKTYTYFWAHVIPGPDAGLYGAFHTSEVPYVLNTLYQSKRPFTDVDRRVADQVSSYWANFATTGNPNGTGLPVWPAVGERPETMRIGDAPGPIPVAGSVEKLAFWERLKH